MKLERKRDFVSRAIGIGKGRIVFNVNRLSEIKEAITKQDIKDLLKDGAIMIREIRGRAKVERRKRARGFGSIRKKVKNSKRKYIILTRKLRGHISQLRRKGEISEDSYSKSRKGIRASNFRSLSHLKEHLKEDLNSKQNDN